MFETFLSVPLHFTVEFLGLLVAAGGAFLVATRPALVPGPVFNRLTVVAGFGFLAAAQVAHGGAFVESDGDELLIGLRGLGLAFLLVGIIGGLRAAPTAGAALQMDEPLLAIPAAAAFLVSLMALVASARGGPKAFRRLALAGVLLGATELLTSVAPYERFGTGLTDAYAYAAHAVKGLGFLALGWWLWAGVKTSIRTRFVASFAALLVAVILALSSALTGVISGNVEREELNRVRAQIKSEIETHIVGVTQDLDAGAENLAGISSAPVARGDDMDATAARLLPDVRSVFEADFLFFQDRGGTLLGRAGTGPFKTTLRPEGPPLTEIQIIGILGTDVVETARSAIGSAAGPVRIHRSLALIAAREVTSERQRVGTVIVGRWIDRRLLEEVVPQTVKVSLVVGNSVISELPDNPEVSDVLPRDVRAEVVAGRIETEQQTINDHSFFSAFAPIERDGVPIGATLVLSTPSRIAAATREDVTRILFLVAMGVGAVALALAWYSGRRITRPIQALTTTAVAVREGNLQAQAEVSGDDEVGQLGDTFNEMTASLFRMTDDLRDAAREEHNLRERIETIIQSMADGLVAVDRERKIVLFNREAEQLTGRESKVVLGKSVEKIVDARNSQGEKVSLPVYDLAEGSVGGVFLARRGTDPVPIAVTSAVLRGEEGEVVGAVAVIRDMTREREVERMKSEFLSNISHELRTPLTPIKGYAEILGSKEVPPAKTKQFVKGILESTSRLERIVELLVDFSALEAGRLAPRNKPVDIGSLVSKIATEWTARCPHHSVVTDIGETLPDVFGDERLLRRSLEEVLDNAVKFSPQGGTITLQAKGASSGNGGGGRRTVELVVSDQGIGIAPEQLGQIFTDFQQLDGSETRAYGGLGLGLAFVRRIIEAHDGSVAVESQPEVGTKLTIRIPAVSTQD